MNHWWRAYNEAVNDPKLQLLSDTLFRAWFNIMCIASANNGELPALKDVAFTLRVQPPKAAQLLAQLHAAGLLDKTETGFRPHNWSGRQYKSDVSTDRVKRFRERKGNVSSAVSETPPETETETETDKPSLRSGSAPAKRGTRLPDDWAPLPDDWREATAKLCQHGSEFELSKFRDYWKAQPGQRGVKLDWNATFRNWIRNARGPANGQRTANPRKTGHDAILAAASRAAREIVGDGEMAGPAGEAEFSFGDGAFGGRPAGTQQAADRAQTGHHGREPFGGTVLEGEIISPDEATAGLSDGWRRH